LHHTASFESSTVQVGPNVWAVEITKKKLLKENTKAAASPFWEDKATQPIAMDFISLDVRIAITCDDLTALALLYEP
jgi:hypothetical protein